MKSVQQTELEELQLLRQEVAVLRNEKKASEAQRSLLETLVKMARSTPQDEMIKLTLQKSIDLVADFTGAEKGSLFLMEPSSYRVIDAVLSRTEVTPELQSRLINTVLDQGLAGWVTRHRELGLIDDTEQDDRWVTLPNQPYQARSALAVPILRGNTLLGIITLLHSQPNRFTPEAAELVQRTADQIGIVLENARLYSELTRYSAALDAELEDGRRMQLDFLPYQLVQAPGWEVAAFSDPAKKVGGDFYDTFWLDGDIGFVIADVCDKGVGAALFMALFRSLLRIFSTDASLHASSHVLLDAVRLTADAGAAPVAPMKLSHLTALQAVERTSSYVATNHWQLNMFATLFFGILDPTTGLLSYINAGHEPLLIFGETGQLKRELPSTGPAVGMLPELSFRISQVQLEPGDLLIGYTDGVTEAKALDGDRFKAQRLKQVLQAQPITSASEILQRTCTKLLQYMADTVQFDDMTMLAVRRLKSGS